MQASTNEVCSSFQERSPYGAKIRKQAEREPWWHGILRKAEPPAYVWAQQRTVFRLFLLSLQVDGKAMLKAVSTGPQSRRPANDKPYTDNNMMKIAIIGAGAAGCFAAIEMKRRCPKADITIYEAGRKPLAKVAVTGGGRCNLTNTFAGVRSMGAAYPRGERLMKRLLKEFSQEDTWRWFESEGVRLVAQDDGCVFPASQDAMEIVNTLLRLLRSHGVRVLTGHRAALIERADGGADGHLRISFADKSLHPQEADAVLLANGGSPKAQGLAMLAPLDVETASPVPSLFSLCLPGDSVTELTGTVVKHAAASLSGTKMRAEGPLLITHWGMSGPAILKLSAYAARQLHDCGYRARLAINWLGDRNAQDVAEMVGALAARNPKKQLASAYPEQLNARLWQHLLAKCGLKADSRWGELGRKGINKLVATLVDDQYSVNGKCRFKEEFVTCGGVALAAVNPSTLESRACPGLYFAGETLDIDGITGGFNLQAAWTTGFVAAKAIANRCQAGGKG